MKQYSVGTALRVAAAGFLMLPGLAMAGAWSLAGVPSTCPFGGGACAPVVAVQFAGDGSTFDAQTSVSIPAGFTAAPVGANGGGCSVVGSNINVTSSTAVLIAAGPTTFCNITYTVAGATAVGSYDITANGGIATGCFDSGGGTVGTCTAHANGTGALVVSAGPPTDPTATVADPADFAAATSIGGTTTTSGTITALNGANGGSTTVTCVSDDPQITITSVPNPATCNDAEVCNPAAIQFTCSATTAAQTANITCTADGPNSAPVVQAPFAIVCPAANVAPTIGATTPPYDADGVSDATPEVTFAVTGIGQTNTQTISVPAAGGSGTSTATYNCSTGSAGFAVTGGNNLTFTGSTGPTPQTVSVQCTAAVAAQTGLLTCVETDADSAGVSRVYDLACPAGLAVAAPIATYSAPPTFGQGAAVGSAVPGSAPYTVDINGGISDGAGGAESLQVTCSLFNSPAFSAVFTPASGSATANAPAPAGTDISAAITCSAPADVPANGTIRCVEVATINGVQSAPVNHDDLITCPAAAVNVSSSPADNSTINLFGVPATTLNGSIGFTNIGSTSTLSCTSTGTVLLGVVPATIPASGSASVPFTCTAGAAGASNTGTIQCTTQDPDNAVFDFTVNCSGLASNPIPAINDLGKVLMAALMIGLGLLGLGLRRQTV